MKRTLGPISLDRRLFFLLVRFGLAVIVFFGGCTGIFLAFGAFLQLLDQIAPISEDVLAIPASLLPFRLLIGPKADVLSSSASLRSLQLSVLEKFHTLEQYK